MARVTVEDCIEKVPNRFELILLASHRARIISTGASLTVERDRDKNPVVALRELGEGTIKAQDLEEEYIHSLQRYVEVDELEPEQGDNPDDPAPMSQMSEEDILRGIEAFSTIAKPGEM